MNMRGKDMSERMGFQDDGLSIGRLKHQSMTEKTQTARDCFWRQMASA